MEYIRPDNLRYVHPDTLRSLKDRLDAESEMIGKLLEGQTESVCSLCESFGYAYNYIPEDWAYIADEENTLLCNNCLGRWHERFTLPELTREIEL